MASRSTRSTEPSIEVKTGVALADTFSPCNRLKLNKPMAGLHARLDRVFGGDSYSAIAAETGLSPASVRRWMRGNAPPVEFLVAACNARGVSADYLLMGRGPIKHADYPAYALQGVSAAALMAEAERRLRGLSHGLNYRRPGGHPERTIGGLS